MILHGRFAESLRWSDKQESDNSQSRVRLGLHFSPFMFDCPFLFLLSHLAWPSSQILSILSEKIALYWNRLVHTEIINADPNCANSSSSIALITRLFTEALKKPLNCHSQQLKNIYRDKDWEKGIEEGGGGYPFQQRVTGWPFSALKSPVSVDWGVAELKLDTCTQHSASLAHPLWSLHLLF